MTKMKRTGFIEKLLANGELRLLIKHSIFTAFSTCCGLAVRYLLLSIEGERSVSVFGRVFSFVITDNTAYIAYYATGIIILYLLKWFHSHGVRARSFIPRALAFIFLYLTSMTIGSFLLDVFTERLLINAELAFWLTNPFTYTINYLGNRLIVFCDVENRQARRYKKLLQKKRGERNGGEKVADAHDSSE